MTIVISLLSLLGFIALTAGTALFVAAEFSLTALERSTIDAAAADGDRIAKQVAHAHRTLSFQLSGAQLGITATTLVTGYLAEPVLARAIRPLLDLTPLSESMVDGISLILSLLLATSISMIFGELVPKNLAISRPLATARVAAPPQAVFSSTFRWAINGMNNSANWVLRRVGIEPAEELRSARSPQELSSLVRASAQSGSLDEGTAKLVARSLQFGERAAEELMTPRVKIECLAHTDTVADLIDACLRTGFSRFPVVNGDLDDTIGIVHIKAAFGVSPDRRHDTTVKSLAHTVPVVPASLDGDTLMERIRGDGLQMALVADEYGGTAGMVTMEDLIEEIVGDVRDEHDDAEQDVRRSGEGWLLSGLLRIDELEEATGFRAVDGHYDTLGGLLMEQLGTIPDVGDEVLLPTRGDSDDGGPSHGTWLARVMSMDGRRVDSVKLLPAPVVTEETGVDHG